MNAHYRSNKTRIPHSFSRDLHQQHIYHLLLHPLSVDRIKKVGHQALILKRVLQVIRLTLLVQGVVRIIQWGFFNKGSVLWLWSVCHMFKYFPSSIGFSLHLQQHQLVAQMCSEIHMVKVEVSTRTCCMLPKYSYVIQVLS